MRVCAWQRYRQLCLMRAATASGFKGEETAMEMRSTRRIVTGHDARGKAVVLFDDMATAKQRGANGVTLFWVTSELPVNAAGAVDRAQTPVGVPPPANGTVFRVDSLLPVRTQRRSITLKSCARWVSIRRPKATRGTPIRTGPEPSTT